MKDIARLEVVCSLEMLSIIVEGSIIFKDNSIFYNNLREIILKRSELMFIGSDEELQKKDNPQYKKLRKGDGNSRLSCDNWNEGYFEDFPHALFLLDLPLKDCQEARNKYGVACYCKEDIHEAKYLFAHEKINIGAHAGRASMGDIQDFSRYKHPFKNLWIIDNYFPFPLVGKVMYYPSIFFKMIKHMYEASAQNHITVHLYLNSNNVKFEDVDIVKLQSWIDEVFINGCDIKLYKLTTNHDRNILTDHLWISSGDSFNKFKLRRNENLSSGNFTTLSITGKANKSYPFVESEGPSGDYCWGIEGYAHILNNMPKYNEFLWSSDRKENTATK